MVTYDINFFWILLYKHCYHCNLLSFSDNKIKQWLIALFVFGIIFWANGVLLLMVVGVGVANATNDGKCYIPYCSPCFLHACCKVCKTYLTFGRTEVEESLRSVCKFQLGTCVLGGVRAMELIGDARQTMCEGLSGPV